jgi:hypothetical protein
MINYFIFVCSISECNYKSSFEQVEKTELYSETTVSSQAEMSC